MIEYYENFILCAELETYYCLVCEERLEKELLKLHILMWTHKRNTKIPTCLTKYPNDYIYQIGGVHYCQICNYIITKYNKIEIHINSASHIKNKEIPARKGRSLVPNRVEESVNVGCGIVVSLSEWHGINKKYNCLICDPDVNVNIIDHINTKSHIINMMNTETMYLNNNQCYRKFNDETLYCFECKTIFPPSLLLEHWNSKEHKVIIEDEQNRSKVKLEETVVEQENIKETGKEIDEDNKRDENVEEKKKQTKIVKRRKKIWIPWPERDEKLETGRDKTKRRDVGKNAQDKKVEGEQIDKKGEIIAQKKKDKVNEEIQEVNKDTRNEEMREKEEKKDIKVETKIDQKNKETAGRHEQNKEIQETKNNMGEQMDKKPEREAIENSGFYLENKVMQIKQENERSIREERKEEEKTKVNDGNEMNLQKEENESLKSEKSKDSEIVEIKDKKSKLLEALRRLSMIRIQDRKEIQKEIDDKKRNETVEKEINKVCDNIQENKETDDTLSRKDIRLRLFHRLRRYFDINIDKSESKCKLCKQYVDMYFQDMVHHYRKHMKVVKEYYETKSKIVKTETIYDHGKARSELAKFGRKHFMKLTQGGVKGYCSLCNIYVAPHISNFEIHISGDRHQGYLTIKGLGESGITNEKPEYKTVSFFSYIKCVPSFVTSELVWVNKEFCISMYSFYLIGPYGPTGKTLKCFACDLEFSREKATLHMNTDAHQKIWFAAEIIVSLEKELFVREIGPGLYHCAWCNVAVPYWQCLKRHFSTVAHRDMKKQYVYFSKSISEWYTEIA